MSMPPVPAATTVPTLYGALPSRTFRCLWMLEELGIEYEWVRVAPNDLSSPVYRALNPNGKMPVLRDGAVTMWESIAINLYLAQKHPGPLWPARDEDRAHVLQWSLWAVSEIEPHVVAALADPAPDIATYRMHLAAPLAVLNQALARSRFLLGPRLTAADVNVAGILGSILATPIGLDGAHDVARWLQQCLARPYPKQFFGSRDAQPIRQ